MKRTPSTIVFSDADAVLSQSASCAEAAAVLQQLASDEVAIVLCSGKTRAELEFVHQQLGIRHPFICEQGGAVFVPNGYFDFSIPAAREVAGYQSIEFGRHYEHVVAELHRAAKRLGIRVVGFSDMSIAEVARECGLSLLEARLAKLRDYDEPFRVDDAGPDARRKLFKALRGAGLECTAGDPLDRVGAPVDSTVGVHLLKNFYRRAADAITCLAVTHTTRQHDLAGLVDHAIMFSDNGSERSVTAVDWAETIVKTLRQLADRLAASASSRGPGRLNRR